MFALYMHDAYKSSDLLQARPRRRDVVAGFRPWHPLVRTAEPAHWVLGLRVALAFTGPVVLAHLLGWDEIHPALMTVPGLLVTLLLAPLPRPRTAAAAGVALAATMAGTVALGGAAGTAGRVALLAAAGAAAGLAVRSHRIVAALAGAVALTLILGDRIPATGDAERWLFLGGLAATAVTLATWPLARLPRRGSAPAAARPAPVRPRPSVPAARHHA